jgi:2-polyprenyl-6-methoxyphenol hydroxylase-like FAD-dependent oxidoreductase
LAIGNRQSATAIGNRQSATAIGNWQSAISGRLMTTLKTEVLIVGAGPTGLSLACQLQRFGIDFIIVERNEGVTQFSKAIGVQARTLEIYEQLGLAQKAIAEGAIASKVRWLSRGQVRGEIHLSDWGRNFSDYPFLLMLEQRKNEELLYEYLRAHGKDVRWQTELESFSQDGAGVTAQTRTADGAVETVEGRYLVGCDGAKSHVRHVLGLTFEGSTFERLFYVADARIDWALPHDAIQVSLARNVFTAFFPMKGEQRYRIVGPFPEGAHESDEVMYEEIEAQIKSEAQLQLEISDVRWFSLYRVHSRRVNRFSAGRGFVAGDAAHIHSPAGAQGMNTGIQDVYNLAWKLAFVIRGKAGGRLLETYSEERLANAKRLLETTDRMFELAAGPGWLLSFVRMTIFPPVAGFVTNLELVRKRFFPLISQTGITYRRASLSDHSSDREFAVKAGDRMPYFLINGKSIHSYLHEPKFHLLVFANDEDAYEDMRQAFKNEYEKLADQQLFLLDERVKRVFGTDKAFAVLLRPDNHIGFISGEISVGRIRAYFNGFIRRA